VNKAVSQHDFATALLTPTLRVPAGLSERRFAVHRNNFVVTLVDALTVSFPVTQALVGQEFFRAMARERVLTAPPHSPVLIDYAIAFPDFIAHFPPAASVPYLADVARIEALRIRAYHAADAAPMAEAMYRELLHDPERLATAQLQLHPACSWFRSRHAAYSLWRAHQDLHDMAAAVLENIDTERAEDVLISRPMLEVHTSCLPAGSTDFLDALATGRSLGESVEHAMQAHPDFDPTAGLALLICEGLVIRLKPEACVVHA